VRLFGYLEKKIRNNIFTRWLWRFLRRCIECRF